MVLSDLEYHGTKTGNLERYTIEKYLARLEQDEWSCIDRKDHVDNAGLRHGPGPRPKAPSARRREAPAVTN